MISPLYIHIPYCLSKCDYCDFFSVPVGKNAVSPVPDEYIDGLCNEILFRKEKFGIEKWNTIYIGGGTPSILLPNQIKKITDAFLKDTTSDYEFTFEANPSDISCEFLDCLMENGVTRLSVGVQSFDNSCLDCVKRRSNSSDVVSSLSLIKKRWQGELSCDLICALPFQTKENFILGLKNLLEYEPNHISMYCLSIEEGTPLAKKIDSGEIPYNFDEADDMWILGKAFLEENSFCNYEVSNFYNKKTGRPCEHNMAYWKMKSYAGAGSGATGSFYKNDYGKNSLRYTNSRKIDEYINFWKNPPFEKQKTPAEIEILSSDDEKLEFFMMGLRLYEGICLSDFETRFNCKILSHFQKVMDLWIQNSNAETYISSEKEYFRLTNQGILFLNKFLQEIIMM